MSPIFSLLMTIHHNCEFAVSLLYIQEYIFEDILFIDYEQQLSSNILLVLKYILDFKVLALLFNPMLLLATLAISR